MDKRRVQMLEELQALQFVAVELNLYLDTHPGNKRALMDYNNVVCRLEAAKRAYEELYGPILNFGFSPSQYPWRWIEEPWPWEIVY